MKISHRHPNSFNTICRSEDFKNYFIPCIINEWNESDPYVLGSTSYNKFHYAVSVYHEV